MKFHYIPLNHAKILYKFYDGKSFMMSVVKNNYKIENNPIVCCNFTRNHLIPQTEALDKWFKLENFKQPVS